ncbi:MAG: phosphoribosylformylglycinamidine cyclo-ligase, partial [Muribaculaceae bacterium]|nr:phosphoribosylformylglycinamidine cyclo-ligase [Muribaculaceae bacterium]
GMVIAVAPEDVDKTLEILNNAGERATVIGKVIKGDNVIKML